MDPKCVLRYEAAADVMQKAPEHYPAHRARCDEFRDRGDLLMVGTFADPQDGALAIFRSRAAAEAFVAGDPFVVHGVVAAHEMKDWLEVYVD
jgi:uncharacterized protein YciI